MMQNENKASCVQKCAYHETLRLPSAYETKSMTAER